MSEHILRIPYQALVRIHIVGPAGAVDRLIENIQAAQLPWFQVQDASDATLMMGQARRHLTALVADPGPPPAPSRTMLATSFNAAPRPPWPGGGSEG